ncbi:hypothetical protein GCM10011521_05330 [Arenimonas soli]|uniref:DUF1415 domain-containing protein n=1 Tax=Arenimonas soli TaxID=2269504 RepID=A0ABQ1HCX6_9GAMM|nr:DUF1415 domain-containing protein [Arenimonas soli]GGA70126.1 hypothetical protein GCM10011521_05330 [Arenimonas soli]
MSHDPMHGDEPLTDEAVVAATQEWLEKAVIGLNLCPFAKAVHAKRQVRYVVSQAADEEGLLQDLLHELQLLASADPGDIETTLLVHPYVLRDFLDYNDFLDIADAAVEELELDGVLQVASFHPQYQFAESAPDDMANFSNRAPFPTLHLLREDSVDKAVEAFPDADRIYETNIAALRRLGPDGWRALWRK